MNSIKVLARAIMRQNAEIQDLILEATQIKNDP